MGRRGMAVLTPLVCVPQVIPDSPNHHWCLALVI